MLLSHSHRFIFIHNYKVAGSSIKQALGHYAYPNPVKRLANRLTLSLTKRIHLEFPPPFYKDRFFPAHVTARELREELPADIFNSFFKFSFVRNPWDWQVSLFAFMKQNRYHWQHEIVAPMTFGDYVHWRVTEDLGLQKDFVVDEDGKLLVDFVGRYERLSEDFQHVCRTLDIDAKLPHSNKSSRRDYRRYYNDCTRELIAQHFKEDIDFFGYSFDTGVRRES